MTNDPVNPIILSNRISRQSCYPVWYPVNPVLPSNRISRQSRYPVKSDIPSIPLSRLIVHPVNPVIPSRK
jgi:hypothetical protein